MNNYNDITWDEGDSSNWLEDSLESAIYRSEWTGFDLPDECLWDEEEE